MRVEPRLNEVVRGARGMLSGIQVVLDAECLVSAVALMFAAMDSLAALTRPVDATDTSKTVFIEWADKYLHPSEKLGCTSTDLYAARCGVLHTHSPESRLEREGKARRLVYEWRQGPSADSAVPLSPDALVIEVEALHRALREAVRLFLIDAETDPATRERMKHHLPSMLCYAPWPRLESVVAA